MTTAAPEFSEAAIFSRAIEADSMKLAPDLARHILSVRLSWKDERRIDELLEKSNEGEISDVERVELENLNHIADLISLWHSKARRVLASLPQ